MAITPWKYLSPPWTLFPVVTPSLVTVSSTSLYSFHRRLSSLGLTSVPSSRYRSFPHHNAVLASTVTLIGSPWRVLPRAKTSTPSCLQYCNITTSLCHNFQPFTLKLSISHLLSPSLEPLHFPGTNLIGDVSLYKNALVIRVKGVWYFFSSLFRNWGRFPRLFIRCSCLFLSIYNQIMS